MHPVEAGAVIRRTYYDPSVGVRAVRGYDTVTEILEFEGFSIVVGGGVYCRGFFYDVSAVSDRGLS